MEHGTRIDAALCSEDAAEPMHGVRCVIQRFEQMKRNTDFHAQVDGPGQQPRALRFRFEDLVHLHGELRRALSTEQRAKMPALPSKKAMDRASRPSAVGRLKSFCSLLCCRRNVPFLDERVVLLNQFLDELCVFLCETHNGDEFASDCVPFGAFVRRAELANTLNARGIAEFGELELSRSSVARPDHASEGKKIFDPIGDLIMEQTTEAALINERASLAASRTESTTDKLCSSRQPGGSVYRASVN